VGGLAGDFDPHGEDTFGLNADVHVRGLAGDGEVADVTLLDQVVRAALLEVLGLFI
jgi:hypothetical protein